MRHKPAGNNETHLPGMNRHQIANVRNYQSLTYRHTDIQTLTYTHTLTYRHTHILTYRHTLIDTLTYTHTHTDIQKH